MDHSPVDVGYQPGRRFAEPSPLHDPLQTLDDTEIYLILEYLSPEDIVRASAVCRRWKAYLEVFISTTAMRRSFPRAWNEHQHCRPLNRVELAREYRRQAFQERALRTGQATAARRYDNAACYCVRVPYVAWSDGKTRFSVENVFAMKAVWQGRMDLFRSGSITRLIPALTQTRIAYVGLAARLDLLFVRVLPQRTSAKDKRRDLVYSIPKDRVVWSKVRKDGDERRCKVEVGRRAYHSLIAKDAFELEFFAEALATGKEVYRRRYHGVRLCSLHMLETEDLIALHQERQVIILAANTGDIIRAVDLIGENFKIEVVLGSDNLVFAYTGNPPFTWHDLVYFYHLRDDEQGGGYRLELRHQRHICITSMMSTAPSLFFKRNMRDCVQVEMVSTTVVTLYGWRICFLREEAASPECSCVPKLHGIFAEETLPLLEAAMPRHEEGRSSYATQQIAVLSLPAKSRETKAKTTRRCPAPRLPRRLFVCKYLPRELRCVYQDEDYIAFRTEGSDLRLLSFRPDW
ncbi:MAG: hypothetical protein M1826_006564 [Phylliscum demangeonii]|nr:MAG: hypothetical protein M1826_006564 [Phylliscum demangeonii]